MAMTRRSFALMLTATVTLRPATIGAGGWAVVTIDELPARVVAGRPLALAFTVRQHGKTLLSGLKPSIEAKSGILNASALAAALQTPGPYIVTIVQPQAGDWMV